MKQENYEHDIIHFLQTNILEENTILNPTTVLRELGIDSYSIVEIILFIERKYNYVMPDHLLKTENFETIEKIASILVKELNQ